MKVILLATGSTSLRDSIEFALLQKKYQVESVANGQSALDFIVENEVDLVITSLNLPLIDGLTLSELLKNHSQSRFTPVIVLVDQPLGEQEIAARAIQVDACMTIPFEIAELLFKIEKLLPIQN